MGAANLTCVSSRLQAHAGLHATVYGVIELTEINSDLDLVFVGDVEQAIA